MKDWLSENKLLLHLGKTESILFGSKYKLSREDDLVIKVDGYELTNKTSVNYLGCVLDNNLSGASMVRKVFGKVNARINFIARYAVSLDRDSLMVLATGLVQCHFDYACCSWMTDLSRTWMIKLQKSQNKLIRFVLGLHCFSHVDNINFQQLGWLPIERRLELQKLKIVHKIINDIGLQYILILIFLGLM